MGLLGFFTRDARLKPDGAIARRQSLDQAEISFYKRLGECRYVPKRAGDPTAFVCPKSGEKPPFISGIKNVSLQIQSSNSLACATFRAGPVQLMGWATPKTQSVPLLF